MVGRFLRKCKATKEALDNKNEIFSMIGPADEENPREAVSDLDPNLSIAEASAENDFEVI